MQRVCRPLVAPVDLAVPFGVRPGRDPEGRAERGRTVLDALGDQARVQAEFMEPGLLAPGDPGGEPGLVAGVPEVAEAQPLGIGGQSE